MAEVQWLSEYEAAKDLTNDTLALIQERNVKYPGGGPEASRISAAARRKLGTLGTLIDNLRNVLESPQCDNLTEGEKNRRRDLLAALRSRREQMLQALKRDQSATPRSSLLLNDLPSNNNAPGRETDATADLDNRRLINVQEQMMRQQDTELEHLERSVTTSKHIALQINEETALHNRLLDELDVDVETTGNRLAVARRKLKLIMRRSGSCKTQLFIFLLLVVLVLVLIVGFKLAIHLL